jgi:hypothetical protein
MELRVGGLVDLVYDHALISSEEVPERFRQFVRSMRQTGHVTRCEPPDLLAFSWGEGLAASSWGKGPAVSSWGKGPAASSAASSSSSLGEGPAGSEVSFELVAAGTDTRLILTHQRLASDSDVIDAAGGWHAHVDILQDRVSGAAAVRPFWATRERLEADYQRLFAP